MHLYLLIKIIILVSIASVNARFSNILGSNGDCSGVSLNDYCCPGSIINPSGDLFNNNDDSLDGVICCVGDPNGSINNGGPSSCTADSATPLTDAPSTAATVAGGSPTLSLSSLTFSSLSLSDISVPGITISGQTVNGGTVSGVTVNGMTTN